MTESPINWWQSKTIWLQILAIVVAILTAVLGTQNVAIDPKYGEVVAAIIAIITIVLRMGTNREIKQ
jgi:hypothetical protein